MAVSPSDAVLSALVTPMEPQVAWELTGSLALDSDHPWAEPVTVWGPGPQGVAALTWAEHT